MILLDRILHQGIFELSSIGHYEKEREDKPHTIGHQEQEDILIPSGVGQQSSAIAESCILYDVQHRLPEGQRTHKEPTQYCSWVPLEYLEAQTIRVTGHFTISTIA